MSAQDNAATYRRWFDEGCSQGNLDLVDELYAPEYVTHSTPPDLPPNREGLKMFIGALREGIPDLNCPVEEVVAEGNSVAGRFSLVGTAQRHAARDPGDRQEGRCGRDGDRALR